jgi:N-methylhydantoinase A
MRLGIDVGGTFTDFVLMDPDRRFLGVGKHLTTPADPSLGALDGTAALCKQHGVPLGQVVHAVHGTTLVANTIIERKGARTGLITTRGFRDALETGREIRYDMYDLFIERPDPLVPRSLRLEVDERLGPDGRVLRPLDPAGLDAILQAFEREGVEAVAVSLMHAFRNPAHEQAIRKWLADRAPKAHVSLSTEVCPEIREYDRTSTTVANAYVQPILARYLGRLEQGLRAQGLGGALSIMLSGGGINTVAYSQAMPVHMIESGPAGGAMAASFLGRRAGIDRLLAFDMGGTTAKLCLVDGGEPYRATTFEAARVHRFMKGSGLVLKVPVIEMIEIGAGGGSIARADRLGLLKVGPHSAGADPGPACYGRGGEAPTVTDADLLLGYLDPGYFLGGRMALDRDRASRALSEQVAAPLGVPPMQAARGVFELVNENMAAAARVNMAERGRDPRQYTFLAFGGAGPVHAWDLARRLKMRRILCPPAAGAASALGFLVVPPTVDLVMSHVARLSEFDVAAAAAVLARLEDEAARILAGAGVPRGGIAFHRAAEMRYVGQGYEIPVPVTPEAVRAGAKGLKAAFDAEYEKVFGRAVSDVPAEVLTWRVRAMGPRPAADWAMGAGGGSDAAGAMKGKRPAYFDDPARPVETPVFDRYKLGPGAAFPGPAIVEERESTAIVPPRARAAIDAHHNLVIELPE